MGAYRRENIGLNLLISFALMIFLLSLSYSLSTKADPVSISVYPEVPRKGVPILVTFNLNNPSTEKSLANYEFYANGVLIMKGKTLQEPKSTKRFAYIYPDSPELGEKVTFLVKTQSTRESFEKAVSIPAYPPQVWMSFVSFASFSTSLMGTAMSASFSSALGSSLGASLGAGMGSSSSGVMSSTQFYRGSFVDGETFNLGIIFSIVLISLLVFLELSDPIIKKGFRTIGLRIRFSKMSAVLFLVFLGMVFTKVVLLVA